MPLAKGRIYILMLLHCWFKKLRVVQYGMSTENAETVT